MKTAVFSMLLWFASFLCFAQATPADAEWLKSLDFLLGEWKVSVNARLSKNGPWEKSEARATIQKAVGNTIYEEELVGTRQGRDFIAKCWMANDNRTQRYQWAFVDSDHGVLVLYEGSADNGNIILEDEILIGEIIINRRIVYSDMGTQSFKVQSMPSVDKGVSWDITGTSLYTRVK